MPTQIHKGLKGGPKRMLTLEEIRKLRGSSNSIEDTLHKLRLIFEDPNRWCKYLASKDKDNKPVRRDSEDAVKWCPAGAIYLLEEDTDFATFGVKFREWNNLLERSLI